MQADARAFNANRALSQSRMKTSKTPRAPRNNKKAQVNDLRLVILFP
jgi:hypothetical protein